MNVDKAMSRRKKVLYKLILDDNNYLEVTANKRTNKIYINLSGEYAKENNHIL